MSDDRILFVTGRLAEPALTRVVDQLGRQHGFQWEIRTLGISVAALMHVDWVLQKLTDANGFDRMILPGWCQGDVSRLSDRWGTTVELGPKDLFDLPEYFGSAGRQPVTLDEYSIEIIAEINHAPRLSEHELMCAAQRYIDAGADVIDLGCIPGETWADAGRATAGLRAAGIRISIDSFNRPEVEAAVQAGAELVLSCNRTNVDWARDLDAELVVIPDPDSDWTSLRATVETLREAEKRFRLDPVLDPIGFGFAAALDRYWSVRREWPDCPMMMGVGNLTELTEADSAPINLVLAAFCEELGIGSVLTTEVINWARTAVAEFDLARRLVRHCVQTHVLPKHIHSQLLMLRDPRCNEQPVDEIRQLASQLTDPNFRIFVAAGQLHLANRDGYWQHRDPFELFDQAHAESPIADPTHAFYLGYELAKATTALHLGKRYQQDQALRWGLATVEETSALERRHRRQTPP